MNTMALFGFFTKHTEDRTAGTLRIAQEARKKVENAVDELKAAINEDRAVVTIGGFIKETRDLRK